MLQGISRRFFLGSAAAAVTSGVTVQSSWLRALASEAGTPLKQVVLLWLHGGPATIDLWDLKLGHANGGPFQEIKTATPGVRLSEHLPRLAELSNELTIIRSMSSREGDHGRAVQLARTGYTPQAGIDFPDLGSLVAKEHSDRKGPSLPRYVNIAPARRPGSSGSGFLGPDYDPLNVGEQAQSTSDLVVQDLQPKGVLRTDFSTNLALLDQFNNDFAGGRQQPVTATHRSAVQRAVAMMQPNTIAAFDLDQEREATRDRFGRTIFGQGCLLARRLIERGVPFVEVSLDGWDTHQDNFHRVANLSERLDTGCGALLSDLSERGLLDSTLVVCMGEFGRTPIINGNAGRDHWPKAWSVMLAGGGLAGGRAIGETSRDGTEVVSEPYSVPDLLASICTKIGIDPRKQNLSNVDRPIRIADPDAKLIEEL